MITYLQKITQPKIKSFYKDMKMIINTGMQRLQ